MEKKEILKKAQEENGGKDLAELEAGKSDSVQAMVMVYLVGLGLFFLQLIAGGGINFGILVIINLMNAVMSHGRCKRNPTSSYKFAAAMYVIALILFLIAFGVSLVKK